ncbi:hypothetical protein GGX14DRAFT_384303 [Mycena pura]|uniref:Uncharacterized protein n=1 Tax=Mycena pura TaxID=153505 RepID=A0AAD7E6G4_9AGAR|nr:hypothetical protein GGX14DRAFT_384303 [Mycena pura]
MSFVWLIRELFSWGHWTWRWGNSQRCEKVDYWDWSPCQPRGAPSMVINTRYTIKESIQLKASWRINEGSCVKPHMMASGTWVHGVEVRNQVDDIFGVYGKLRMSSIQSGTSYQKGSLWRRRFTQQGSWIAACDRVSRQYDRGGMALSNKGTSSTNQVIRRGKRYYIYYFQLYNNYVVDVKGEDYNGHDAAHVKGITDHQGAGLKLRGYSLAIRPQSGLVLDPNAATSQLAEHAESAMLGKLTGSRVLLSPARSPQLQILTLAWPATLVEDVA